MFYKYTHTRTHTRAQMANIAAATEYDYLFKLLLIGDSGVGTEPTATVSMSSFTSRHELQTPQFARL